MMYYIIFGLRKKKKNSYIVLWSISNSNKMLKLNYPPKELHLHLFRAFRRRFYPMTYKVHFSEERETTYRCGSQDVHSNKGQHFITSTNKWLSSNCSSNEI